MISTHSRRPALDRRPCRLMAAAALLAAAAFSWAPPAGAAAAAQPADAPLAAYRGGAVTRAEFQAYQKHKSGPEGYAALLKDRAGLRESVRRLALNEVVAALAVEAGARESDAFQERHRALENELRAALWRKKIADAVTVTDAELDHMVPEPEDFALVAWASLATEEEARAFAAALRGGADFAAAGRAAGVAEPALGEARLVPGGESHFSPASQALILALKKGEVAGPLREPIGWYVVRCIERADPAALRARERDRLRPQVLKSARERAIAAAAAALRAKSAVVVDEKALAAAAATGIVTGGQVALVNGEPVFFAQQEQHGFPRHGDMEKLLRGQLDDQIAALLAAQESRRLKLEAQDPEWQARLDGIALDLLADTYRERVFASFTVSEAEVRVYFAENPELFKTRTTVRLRQIVLNSEYLAGRYRADLLAGRASFEELARRESLDRKSAEAGGDMGWMAEDSVRPELYEYVRALRPGEITVPVRVAKVLYLVKLEARTEPEPIPWEQARERARARALLAKRTSSWVEFLSRKQKEAEIVLDEAAIDAFAAQAR